MAQIRVEQKRSGLGWLWAIIALLAAAALVWFLVASGRTTIGSEGSTPGDTLRTGDTTRTSRVAPAESRAPLGIAHSDLIAQVSDGVSAYERLVAAAAGYLAEDGRTGAKYLDSATTRLTEAADLLRGVSAGLAELRGSQ